MTDRTIIQQHLSRSILGIVFAWTLLDPVAVGAQPVYAANQVSANGVEIGYRLEIAAPAAHLYRIEIDIRGIRESSLRVAMPAWAPGDYRIQDFARNVQNFGARAGGRALEWRKSDKQTWEILKQPGEDVRVSYELFSEGLTPQMADISGPATYMYVVGHRHVPVTVSYDKPRSWDIHTGLDGRGTNYRAPDYDVFIDAPTFAADARTLEFESGNTRFQLVFSDPRVEFNEPQILADFEDIVEAAADLFGAPPFDTYMFLIKIEPESGGGGLGHLNSSRITAAAEDFSSGPRYDRFLFTASQEFVAAWNGKRIRPASESRLDYTRETYTPLLWLTRGLTRYYARRLLARTGILDASSYLIQLSQEIDRLQHQPGRSLMSLEEASWDTWIPGDNSENNSISYSTKGEIAGLLLDLEIRVRTRSEKSLDDLMRYLLENFANQGLGVPDDGVLDALNAITATEFAEFYQTVIQSRTELDYNRHLAPAGLRVQVNRQLPVLFMGVQVTEADGNRVRIDRVLPESPAQAAGLDTGDILLAFGERLISFENFQSEFRQRKLGETIDVTIARGQRILQLEVEPTEIQPETWTLLEDRGANPEQVAVRDGWLRR